ncbi:MAG: methyltransferase, partial [Planctomycetaceae bacterium]|nr:methyltransferase [Planctomycetaceae bacterium]
MSVSNRAELEQFLQDSYARDPLVQFRLSGGEEPDASGSVRHEIRPVEIRNQVQLQWTSIDAGGRQTHQNSDWPSSLEKILALFGQPFRNLLVRLPEEDWQIGLDRKNRFRVQKHRTSPKTKPVSSSHDTSRQYLLPEGQPIPFLVELGVMTPEGKVRAAQQKKFRQINRFLEFLADVKDRFPTYRVMQVIDYGCGKSYLTFAVREYLVQKLGLQVEIHAYDSNSGIIDECEKVR